MDITLGAFEILTMAEQIERDSVDFYRRAASRVANDELRSLFSQLADWERKHEEIFGVMKRDVTEKSDNSMIFDEASYVTSNPQRLHSLAKSAVKNSPEQELSQVRNKLEVLDLALKREADAIRFFRALHKYALDAATKAKIKAIIEEEKKHVSILTQALQQSQ